MRTLQRSRMNSFQPAAADDDAVVCLRLQARRQAWGRGLSRVHRRDELLDFGID